ncbi:MAG: C1 family peptidase [Treponema sp.]|nr:C1 family peptidase [Treponema sp.]MCL2251546.1 C1 family peptidase [Treponema sp.]
MPQNKKFLCFFLLLFLLSAVFISGQGRGAIFDEQYENLPRRAELAGRSYEGLPSSFSLRRYAPLPGDQADYGTCVAWAAAYAARTISESIALNRLNQTETTQNAFSPVYIYRNIRPDDPMCIQGAQIYSALDFMRDVGTVKTLDVERNISFPRVDLAYYRTVRKYPIADYVTLFSRDDRQKPAIITRIVKKSISEGKPVIIGMNTPDSFLSATEVWRPREDPNIFYEGHALCVIGYDDAQYGGSFEVLNSWGRKWGNGGYIWIPYKTFTDFVSEGYEIIENIANFSTTNKFEGFVRMEIAQTANNNTERAVFKLNKENIYTSAETFTQGTKVNFIVGARESAYVYSFVVTQPQESDTSNFYSPVLLFPEAGRSPLLNYSDSIVVLPGEERTINLDTQGTTYLITLYSKYSLNILSIMRTFSSASGSINKRLAAAIGDNYTASLSFNENEAAFTLTPDNPNTVAVLVVAIQH